MVVWRQPRRKKNLFYCPEIVDHYNHYRRAFNKDEGDEWMKGTATLKSLGF
jgi:hypothetical protein